MLGHTHVAQIYSLRVIATVKPAEISQGESCTVLIFLLVSNNNLNMKQLCLEK